MGDEDKNNLPDLNKLQAEKLQTEIDKNKAEQAETEKRTKEIEKRLNQRMIFGIPVYQTFVGGIVAGVFIITFSWTFLTPILNKDSEIAKRRAELLNIENKLERASLDSLNTDLTAQKGRLERQMKLITTRLDSTEKRNLRQLELANIELKKEKSKARSNQKKINDLSAQISAKEEEIKRVKNEKKQIIKIAGMTTFENLMRKLKRNNKELFWSEERVKHMIVEQNFFDMSRNRNGTGIKHQYEAKTIKGDSIIVDHTTQLTWQQGGSRQPLSYEEAGAYIQKICNDKFAGFDDWRLPTLYETMTIMERPEKNYIDSKFDPTQKIIWTADSYAGAGAWIVDFAGGFCSYSLIFNDFSVRAVR